MRNPDFCLAGKRILRDCVVYVLSPSKTGGGNWEQNASRGEKKENSTKKKAARPREPCWRQTRRRSRACSTAGWGQIKHGRHRTQRCHFLKQLKPTFTQLSSRDALKRVIPWYQTRVRARKAEIKAMRKQEEVWKNRSGPRWPGSTIQGKPWHTAHIVHIPSSYLQLMLCCPLYFSLLSVRINPLAFTNKNRRSTSECRGKCIILYPTTVGTSRAAISPPTRHNSSIVPRVPPGPKPRRIHPHRACVR